VGCAVAYRRKYVKALFDQHQPILGDDLTNSEDIFIGFAMLNEGYRNIQLTDVYAGPWNPKCSVAPPDLPVGRRPFLQSCYYFDPMMRSPFKAFQAMAECAGGRRGRDIDHDCVLRLHRCSRSLPAMELGVGPSHAALSRVVLREDDSASAVESCMAMLPNPESIAWVSDRSPISRHGPIVVDGRAPVFRRRIRHRLNALNGLRIMGSK